MISKAFSVLPLYARHLGDSGVKARIARQRRLKITYKAVRIRQPALPVTLEVLQVTPAAIKAPKLHESLSRPAHLHVDFVYLPGVDHTKTSAKRLDKKVSTSHQ